MSPYIIIVILSVSVVLVACLAYCLNLVYRIYHSKHNLESAFDSFNDPIAIIDNTYTITRVNKPFAQLIGKDFQDILLNRCYAVFRNRTSPCEDCQLQSVLNSGSQGYVSRSPHPHKNSRMRDSIIQ
jgi:PAS domain-containing protein